MSNANLGDQSVWTPAARAVAGDRRARRAERQAMVSHVAIASAFVFVSAVVFGLL